LIIRFCGHTASILGLRRREGYNFERGLFFSLWQFEMFDFRIPVFESVEVEQQKVLVFYFFADGDVASGGGDGDAFDVLDVV
jgi:hypothetical protein